ncbi:hypothetical protein AMJ57_03395 [Parcubacteria bacterium SG8_24]|nr:MAG: hypothetical protein AMJ57_03395 [Parcubacteria bacterium SG8_24]
MEIRKIVTGSWFPRTKLHLKEYFIFLREGTSHLPIDHGKLRSLHKKLSPKGVKYVGGRFDRVMMRSREYDVTFHEDGLLTIARESPDPEKDLRAVREMQKDFLNPVLSTLYSIGAPLAAYPKMHEYSRPVVIVTEGAKYEGVRELMDRNREEVHFVARHGNRTVYFSDNLIVVDGPEDAVTQRLVDSLILAREYEHKLQHYLELHRVLWTEISKIQERGTIPSKELPQLRSRLMGLKRNLAAIRSRINQMLTRLDERRKQIDGLGLEKEMRALEAYRYEKLAGATGYMMQLWEMLDEYLDSTTQIIGLIYQEKLQREINVQQAIFLVSAVAGLVAVGLKLSGSDLLLYGPDGQMLSVGTLNLVRVYKYLSLAVGAIILTLVGLHLYLRSRSNISSAHLFRTPGTPKARLTKGEDY